MSRNVAFNENDEPKELEEFAKLPGLQAEGEDLENPSLQTGPETQTVPPKKPSTSPDISEAPEAPNYAPEQLPLITEN